MVKAVEKLPLLEARGIHKHFVGVHALNDVTAAFYPGEVVAVMGENGAGKSTLMKCLSGIHSPTGGEIFHEGKAVTIRGVRDAEALGIAFIHQELNLADNLSVGANVFLGREPRRFGMIDEATIREKTAALIDQLGMDFSPDEQVSRLSIGHQQMVEIAKALSQDAKLLIMDEPTSSLSQGETETLMRLVDQLRKAGLCIVFISHRLAEVQEIADRVIVLRDGSNSGQLQRDEISRDRIVAAMVGRELNLEHHGNEIEVGDVLLKVSELRTPLYPGHPASFELRAGEITGMAGLVGAGRTELARCLFGIDQALGGEIEVNGEVRKITCPQDAIAAAIALVPENRKEQGVVVEMSICDNVAMAGLDRHQRAGFVRDAELREVAEQTRQRLKIKAPSIDQAVVTLSGGNQQKVVLGKWISLEPKIFLLDEPTRGVDIGSKSEIYEVIEQMAKAGAAVLFISSELEEILRISDRILVMHEGEISGELSRAEASEESVMQLATGTARAVEC